MNKIGFNLVLLSVLSISSTTVFAHSGALTTGLHLIEHLKPVLVLAILIVLVARVVWLKRQRDS